MSHDHDHSLPVFTGQDNLFRRVLILVILINLGMFGLEMVAGAWAGSVAVWGDSLDFLADGLTYSLSLIATTWSPRGRAKAALFKGCLLVVMAVYVLGTTVYRAFILATPEPMVMGAMGILALCANVLTVLLLWRWRTGGDANIQSTWLCSRNDTLANVALILAAIGVFGSGSAWPDLVVAAIIAGLFLSTAWVVVRKARHELSHAHNE